MSKANNKPPSRAEGDAGRNKLNAGKPGANAPQETPRLETEGNEEKNVVHIETEGFGKFEFIDGTIYEGQWKLINSIKMRHGEGVLHHAGILQNSTDIHNLHQSFKQ